MTFFQQESSVTLIQGGEFERLSDLLEPKEFRALSILILVVGWEHCVNTEAARMLVNVLKKYVVSTGIFY